MEIKTKFTIGNDVWFMDDNQPRKAEITQITIEVGKDNIMILYHYQTLTDNIVNERRCYATKKELVESFLTE